VKPNKAIALASVIVAVLLTGCGRQIPPSATPVPARRVDHTPVGSFALVYDPTRATPLMADDVGIWRWAGGWEPLGPSAPSGVTALALDPERPETLFAAGVGVGVLRSEDGGQTWAASSEGLPNPSVTALALHSYRSKTLLAWVQGQGIYRTENGGRRWERMPDPGPPDKHVRGLVHSDLPGSMNTGWLYASTPTGVYLSMDCF